MENIERRVTEIENSVRSAALSGIQERKEGGCSWKMKRKKDGIFEKIMSENFL